MRRPQVPEAIQAIQARIDHVRRLGADDLATRLNGVLRACLAISGVPRRKQGEFELGLQRADLVITSFDMAETGRTLGEGGFGKVYEARMILGDSPLLALRRSRRCREVMLFRLRARSSPRRQTCGAGSRIQM